MKYWVFDLDGTLIDSFGHFFETVAPHIPQKLTQKDKLYALSVNPDVFLSQWMSRERAQEVMRELIASSIDQASAVPKFKGMAEAISLLKNAGRRIAVYTNRDFDSARAVLAAAGWDKIVEILVSRNCVKNLKPHVEGLAKVQAFFGCAAHEMVMVGDHHYDVAMAKEHGAFAVRASWHPHWEHEPCVTADKQFFCHDDFAKWIREITK